MLSVRRIQAGEYKLYRELRLQSLQESPGAFGSTYVDALKRNSKSWAVQSDGGARGSDQSIFVAFMEKRPIGLSALYRLESHKDIGALMQVWVMPEFRRKAVAVALMDTMFAWASKHKFKEITAGTMAGNKGAMTFYQKYGFSTKTGLCLNCPEDAVVLIKDVK